MKEWQITEYIGTPSAKAILSLKSPHKHRENMGMSAYSFSTFDPKPESWQSFDWIEWHQCCTYKPPLPGLLPQRKTFAQATLQSTNMATEHETFHTYMIYNIWCILVILCHWTSYDFTNLAILKSTKRFSSRWRVDETPRISGSQGFIGETPPIGYSYAWQTAVVWTTIHASRVRFILMLCDASCQRWWVLQPFTVVPFFWGGRKPRGMLVVDMCYKDVQQKPVLLWYCGVKPPTS